MFTLANERIMKESTVWDALGLVQPGRGRAGARLSGRGRLCRPPPWSIAQGNDTAGQRFFWSPLLKFSSRVLTTPAPS
jgi:hypothetical protein